jgi:hypothetical protein
MLRLGKYLVIRCQYQNAGTCTGRKRYNAVEAAGGWKSGSKPIKLLAKKQEDLA